MRINSDIQGLDPENPAAAADQDVMMAIFNKLVSYKPLYGNPEGGTDWGWELEAATAVEQPVFDRIEVFPIDDPKTAEIAYEAGQLDMTGVAASSMPRYQAELPADSKMVVMPSLFYEWLGMNVDHAPGRRQLHVAQVQTGVTATARARGRRAWLT